MTSALSPLLAARLSLTPEIARAGRLDGAWWPRSQDLAAEVPPLADALDEYYGHITRVTVHPLRWPVVPHKVLVAGRTVRVGWFTEQDPDTVTLLAHATGRCDLLVVPPETGPAAAARLMTAAAVPGSVLTAGVLLSEETANGRRFRDLRSGEDAWETDGGPAPPPVRHPVVGSRMIPLPRHMRR